MAKLIIEPIIPKTWHPIIEFLESVKDDKSNFVDGVEIQLNKGLKNPLEFVQYVAKNYETIKKKMELYHQRLNYAITRLDNIGENKQDHVDIEVIQDNLMKQESILKATFEDLNLIYENMTIYIEDVGEEFSDRRKADLLAMIKATLIDMKAIKKLISQERGGLVQSKMVSIAARHKKAA